MLVARSFLTHSPYYIVLNLRERRLVVREAVHDVVNYLRSDFLEGVLSRCTRATTKGRRLVPTRLLSSRTHTHTQLTTHLPHTHNTTTSCALCGNDAAPYFAVTPGVRGGHVKEKGLRFVGNGTKERLKDLPGQAERVKTSTMSGRASAGAPKTPRLETEMNIAHLSLT